MNRQLILAALTMFAAVTAQCALAADAPARKAHVLFLTQSKGYIHDSVKRQGKTLAPAEIATTQLGQQTGLFDTDCTQEASDINRDNLKNYDIVMFYTTGDLPIDPAELKYFIGDWLKQKGHGFVGFHSATDTYHENELYWDMIGATFVTHPWQSFQKVTISVHDTHHPVSRPFGEEFQIRDEIYRYRHWHPEKVHVLMSLNMEKCFPLLSKDGRKAYLTHTYSNEPYQVPIAWVKDFGQGRIFYTNLGHNERTWRDKRFLKSLEGGVRWILGLEPGDATPNPELSKAEEEKAKAIAKKYGQVH